jgi:hypothetical protein
LGRGAGNGLVVATGGGSSFSEISLGWMERAKIRHVPSIRMNARRYLSIVAVVWLAFTKPIAEAAAPMTMADLLVACYGEEGGPERNFCLGYLLGMWDALPAEDACVTPGTPVSAGMLREIFLTGVGSLFPDQPAKDVSAGFAAWTVLHHYFPCPKSAKTPAAQPAPSDLPYAPSGR